MTAPSSFIAKKLFNIPLIYDAHNIETERLRNMTNVSSIYVAITKLMERSGCRLSDLIFVVSERDKEQLATWGVEKSKIEVIPNSVDLGRFSTSLDGNKIRNQYALEDKTVLIFHGPMSYPPNEEAAMILANNVLPYILKKHPTVCLLLVGRNPPRISHPNIIVTGFVKNLLEFIAAADIAVVPLLKGGGTRIKILEYMACGKAVVSTFKGAEGLNLKNGRDILVTEYPDSKFVDLIERLIEDVELRKRIGANARRKIELSYDWKITAGRAVQDYDKLVRVYKRNDEIFDSRVSLSSAKPEDGGTA